MDTKGSQNLSPCNLETVPIAEEDSVVYIAIKGSLHANDCSVFGLGNEEIRALFKKFPGSGVVVNGVLIKSNVLDAVNSLSQLGYKIISSTVSIIITNMDHGKKCDHTNCTHANASVSQTLSEMHWERGLWYAAFYGDEETVRHLIAKARNAKEIVNTPDNSGYTPMHYAARKGYVDICKILLQNGALIDAKTNSGQATPLLKAAAAGKVEAIKFLIQSGASVDAQDADGQTALHKAIENKHFDLVNFLMETYPKLNTMKDIRGRCPSDNM